MSMHSNILSENQIQVNLEYDWDMATNRGKLLSATKFQLEVPASLAQKLKDKCNDCVINTLADTNLQFINRCVWDFKL